MHILYIHDQKIEKNNHSGVVQKIKEKIQIWESQNVKVTVLSLYSFTFYNASLEVVDDRYAFHIQKHGRWVTLFRLMYSTLLMFLFLGRKNFDLIYMRARPYMPLTRLALKKYKVVIELNTDDVLEYKALSRIMYYVNLYTRRYFYSMATAFISVSEEIALRYREFNKKIIVIANGINTKNYPFLEVTNNLRGKIVFIGSANLPWHGEKKIEWLSEKLPQYDFHIIGIEGKNRENLFFYGAMQSSLTAEFIKDADVAISTLALHVKGMNEASPLKSRQYLAQGIPMIYAYDDTDLIYDYPFCLKLPNTENNVEQSLMAIRDFVEKCMDDKKLRLMTRTFAEEHLDIKAKEFKRLAYLKSL